MQGTAVRAQGWPGEAKTVDGDGEGTGEEKTIGRGKADRIEADEVEPRVRRLLGDASPSERVRDGPGAVLARALSGGRRPALTLPLLSFRVRLSLHRRPSTPTSV